MKTVIIGAGGHSRVVYDTLRSDHNVTVSAFVDNSPRGSEETIMSVPVIGDHDVLPAYVEENDIGGFIIAVGDNKIRRRHFQTFRQMDIEPISAIHPDATISKTANIGPGSVVASGAIITTNSEVGENSIVNTGSVVEHESDIGDHTHVGPGTTIAGRVEIGDGTFVGMGSSVTDYTTVGENVTIGAGSVVLDDVESGTVVAGTPAELKRQKGQE